MRGAIRWGGGLLAGLLVAAAALETRSARPIAEGVQLRLSTEEIEPTTTFELRFDEPVAAASDAGLPARESPLAIEPPLSGQFVWLSSRSGAFTPTEPPRLDQEYQFRLRRGLRGAGGEPVSARLDQRRRTPPFGITAHSPRRFDTNDLPARPQVQLEFNADLSASAARPFIFFLSDQGVRIEAQVRPSTWMEYFERSYDPTEYVSPLTWRQRFNTLHPAPEAARSEIDIRLTPAAPESPAVGNRLTVTPEHPLAPGGRWVLHVGRGLPAAEDGLVLREPRRIFLGAVRPFELESMACRHEMDQGRWIQIRFTRPLSSELDSTNIAEWIDVQPAPAGLKMEVGGRQIALQGAFGLGIEYAVIFRAGLPGADGFALTDESRSTVAFEPLEPRLFFPAFAADQSSGGRRQFEWLALNTGQVRVRAKVMEPENIVHALRGYRSYLHAERRPRDSSPFQEVDYNVVPGRTVWDRVQTVKGKIDESQHMSLAWDEVLGGRSNAVVFLEARAATGGERDPRGVGVQSLVQLTDWGMAWKRAGRGLWIWLFSYTTGEPVRDARIRLVSDENEPLAETRTDAQGMGQVPWPEEGRWLLAQKGDDLRAVELTRWKDDLPVYRFDIDRGWGDPGLERLQVLLFSDRPVYRPGETVRLKAVARQWTGQAWEIPAELKGRLQGGDARGREFLSTNVALSALGSIDLSIPLPAAPRGMYALDLSLGSERHFYHHFRVEEYQPNAFEVGLETRPSYAAGERLEFPIRPAYYSGARLSRARVRWLAEVSESSFAPAGLGDYWFGNQDSQWGSSQEDQPAASTWHGELTCLGPTNCAIRPEMDTVSGPPGPKTVGLLVEVTDLNQQTVAQRAQFVRHSSDFYLGIRRLPNVVAAGRPQAFELVAVNADGLPRPEIVPARIRVHRIEWKSVRVEGTGSQITYENERELEPVAELESRTLLLERRGARWIHRASDAGGRTNASAALFTPAQAGDYLAEATAIDPAGRAVRTAVEFSVGGPDELAWDYENEVQIELLPDQARYRPGQTATILVKTPLAGQALVTVEREAVRRSWVARLDGNAPTVQVPILEGDAPNVYVSVLILRGSDDSPRQYPMPEYRLGYCSLEVESPGSKLRLDVASARPEYRPGDSVELAATVLDGADRRPVAGAEVTLFAVDEGVLSLMGYDVPDPHAFFMAPRPLFVESASTLPNLLAEDPAALSFGNKGYRFGAGGGLENVRKLFLACAFWQGALRTDEHGRVTARFKAPDSLTEYRIMAVAHTARSQFGSGESRFRVNKPLMIEPFLPQFGRVGDRWTARATVRNQSDQPRRVRIELELDDQAARIDGTDPRTIDLAPRTSRPVEFQVELAGIGMSRWIWRATEVDPGGAGAADAVESKLTVHWPTPLLTEVLWAEPGGPATNLLAEANPQLLEGNGELRIEVANSRLARVAMAAEHLLYYPYGCVEQTASSLIPWLALRDRLALFPAWQVTREQAQQAIAQGVQKLLAMQSESGGLSYWPGNNSPMLWASAYGGLALVLADAAGAGGPAASQRALMDYLRASLRGASDLREPGELADCCLVLFVLARAKEPERSYHELMYRRRDSLSRTGRAWLAYAIAESGGPAELVEDLLVAAAPKPVADDSWFGGRAREVAVQLLAWSRFRPEDPRAEALLRELFEAQRGGHWMTTQGNAWSLLALTDYLGRQERGPRQLSVELRWGGRKWDVRLPGHPMAWATNLTYRGGKDPQAFTAQPIDGPAPLVMTRLEMRPSFVDLPRQDHGLSLQRQYAVLDDENRPGDSSRLRVGDRILVTLQLESTKPAHFVAIDDPLPAIFEPIRAGFRSQATGAESLTYTGWWSDFQEMRADRVLFFRDHLPAGTHTIRYLARVYAAGAVTAPAGQVQEMYHPERNGLTGTRKITSEALFSP